MNGEMSGFAKGRPTARSPAAERISLWASAQSIIRVSDCVTETAGREHDKGFVD